ncbi:MAG: ABC transporter ATP-binding protein [Nitrososphaerota archaeon]|nr:energy-coupling factor ABC transporter ATP-binding protein [Aigarchaeota archaeon]MDW8076450.1 ABC transporter ATP-binding protein [Nitrososphaerota archaeon]
MEIVKVEGLTFTYNGSNVPAISDINLSIEEGEFVLLLGPSGCGKSTLCRCLNGLIPHFYAGKIDGKVVVAGMEVSKTPTYVLSQHVGMVFQNPENQLFSLTVENDVAFALENLGMPRDEIRRRVDFALKAVGIEDLRKRSPFELSGGQQQKVAIASILALMPKLMILDEPTSSLDPVSAKSITEAILRIKKELGISIIVAEHRVELLADKVDRVIVMQKGRIVKDGRPREIFVSDEMISYGVPVPKVVGMAKGVNKHIQVFNEMPLSPEEFERGIRRFINDKVR